MPPPKLLHWSRRPQGTALRQMITNCEFAKIGPFFQTDLRGRPKVAPTADEARMICFATQKPREFDSRGFMVHIHYSFDARIRNVTACALVHGPFGSNVVSVMPIVTAGLVAQATASR